jgi:hypothetical protein
VGARASNHPEGAGTSDPYGRRGGTGKSLGVKMTRLLGPNTARTGYSANRASYDLTSPTRNAPITKITHYERTPDSRRPRTSPSFCGRQNSSRVLTRASTIGTRAHSPHLPSNGRAVRLDGAPRASDTALDEEILAPRRGAAVLCRQAARPEPDWAERAVIAAPMSGYRVEMAAWLPGRSRRGDGAVAEA